MDRQAISSTDWSRSISCQSTERQKTPKFRNRLIQNLPIITFSRENLELCWFLENSDQHSWSTKPKSPKMIILYAWMPRTAKVQWFSGRKDNRINAYNEQVKLHIKIKRCQLVALSPSAGDFASFSGWFSAINERSSSMHRWPRSWRISFNIGIRRPSSSGSLLERKEKTVQGFAKSYPKVV